MQKLPIMKMRIVSSSPSSHSPTFNPMIKLMRSVSEQENSSLSASKLNEFKTQKLSPTSYA